MVGMRWLALSLLTLMVVQVESLVGSAQDGDFYNEKVMNAFVPHAEFVYESINKDAACKGDFKTMTYLTDLSNLKLMPTTFNTFRRSPMAKHTLWTSNCNLQYCYVWTGANPSPSGCKDKQRPCGVKPFTFVPYNKTSFVYRAKVLCLEFTTTLKEVKCGDYILKTTIKSSHYLSLADAEQYCHSNPGFHLPSIHRLNVMKKYFACAYLNSVPNNRVWMLENKAADLGHVKHQHICVGCHIPYGMEHGIYSMAHNGAVKCKPGFVRAPSGKDPECKNGVWHHHDTCVPDIMKYPFGNEWYLILERNGLTGAPLYTDLITAHRRCKQYGPSSHMPYRTLVGRNEVRMLYAMARAWAQRTDSAIDMLWTGRKVEGTGTATDGRVMYTRIRYPFDKAFIARAGVACIVQCRRPASAGPATVRLDGTVSCPAPFIPYCPRNSRCAHPDDPDDPRNYVRRKCIGGEWKNIWHCGKFGTLRCNYEPGFAYVAKLVDTKLRNSTEAHQTCTAMSGSIPDTPNSRRCAYALLRRALGYILPGRAFVLGEDGIVHGGVKAYTICISRSTRAALLST